jgi:hypothetical protein
MIWGRAPEKEAEKAPEPAPKKVEASIVESDPWGINTKQAEPAKETSKPQPPAEIKHPKVRADKIAASKAVTEDDAWGKKFTTTEDKDYGWGEPKEPKKEEVKEVAKKPIKAVEKPESKPAAPVKVEQAPPANPKQAKPAAPAKKE